MHAQSDLFVHPLAVLTHPGIQLSFGASGTNSLLDLPGACQPLSVSGLVSLHVCFSGRLQAEWGLLILGDT